MNTRTRNRIFAAVAASLPVIFASLPAHAQVRADQNGQALDANNRVGSGGNNDASSDRNGPSYTGNQLVTGNVSGGRSVRAPVGYRDPYEFTGPTGRRDSDRFRRDSVAAPTRTNPYTNYSRATAYYGDTRSTPPPAGFRADAFTGGYYNTGTIPIATGQGINPSFRSTSEVFSAADSMIRPRGLLLDGGLDANNQPQLLSASPLYGVLPISQSLLDNASGNNMNTAGTTARNPSDRFRLDPAQIDQMREELAERSKQAVDDPANQAQSVDSKPLSNEAGAVQGDQTLSGSSAQAAGRNQIPLENRSNNQIDNRLDVQPLEANIQPLEGQSQSMAVPPSRQSKQYAALQKRFQMEQAGRPISAEEANMNQRRLNQAQVGGTAPAGQNPGDAPELAPGEPAAPAGVGPGVSRVGPPGGKNVTKPAQPPAAKAAQPPAAKTVAPTAPAPAAAPAPEKPAAAPAANRPAPIRIKSLADGVEAKGLHDLLVNAEELMRAGKFSSAIDKYVAAEQVAPNNPLLRLGRAHAELGATKYGSAEMHLREAITADPALLMGQYDLEAFYGRDRLAFIVSDLKQMALTETASPRPKLLLAYIAYSVPGQEAAAADHLKEASDLMGRVDPLIQAMRKHWGLDGGQPAAKPTEKPEVNK